MKPTYQASESPLPTAWLAMALLVSAFSLPLQAQTRGRKDMPFADTLSRSKPALKVDSTQAALAEIDPDMVLKAYAWGLGGTFGPLALAYVLSVTQDSHVGNVAITSLIVSGAFFGPSAGQFYAHSPGAAGMGLGIRALGTVIAVAGAVSALKDAFCGFNDDGEDRQSSCSDHGGGTIAVVGLLTYAGGVVYSLVDTRAAVHRYREGESSSGFGWTPVIRPGRDGDMKAGAVAYYRF